MRCQLCKKLVADTQVGITRHYDVHHPGIAAPLRSTPHEKSKEVVRYASEKAHSMDRALLMNHGNVLRTRMSKGLMRPARWKAPQPAETLTIKKRRKRAPDLEGEIR